MAHPRKKKISEQQVQMRSKLWPEISESELWHRSTSNGWLTLPRAFPLVLRIMDMLADKGKPVSATYLDLWCRTFDNSFVVASKPREMAYYAGFTGERAQHTWTSRIRKLVELGFICIAEGASGPAHYILILNPFHVIQRHIVSNSVNLAAVNTLTERMIEIGADDLNVE